MSYKRYIVLLFTAAIMVVLYSSCEKTKSCPQGNLCVEGNTLIFQPNPNGAKLIIDAPPGSVYNNAAVVLTDMVPMYPASANFGAYERHFAGGMFKIEPFDLELKKLITVSIEYPGNGFIDVIGNNFEEELTLYFIDDDGNWSIVNASEIDMDGDRVSAQVTRLGIYAVGAKKDCIIGDWRYITPLFPNFYLNRVVFTTDGKGKRETLVICNETDTSYAVENFSWSYEDDKISMHNFSALIACDTLGFTSPDRLVDYDCSAPFLSIFDFTQYDYLRFY